MHSLLEQIIEPQSGGFSSELARYVLSLHFSQQQKDRYLVLAEKANEGGLSESEQKELDDFVTANSVLMLLQSKARIATSTHSREPV